MKSTKGTFLAFEGIDGSGKTTHKKILIEKLKNHGIRVIDSVEPTSNPIGKFIREQYLSGVNRTDQKVIQSLFLADRLDSYLNEKYGILYQLEDGTDVIQDRSYLSSIAYGALTMSIPDAINIQRVSINILQPTVVVFIDTDPEVALKRISKRKGNKEIYDTLEQQKVVRRNYIEAIDYLYTNKISHENIITIDGAMNKQEMAERIWSKVAKYF